MQLSIARPVFHVSVVAVMLFQVAALFARSILESFLIEQGTSQAVADDLSNLIVLPILVTLMFPYLNRCKHQLLDLLRASALSVRLVLLALSLGLTLRMVRWAGLTVLLRLGILGNDDPNAIVGPLVGFDCPPALVLFTSLSIMALLIPIIEEVIHRGFILHALLPRGLWLSVPLSAALFSFMHAPGSYFAAFLIGLLLALQTLNSGTLWAAIVTHAAYNAAAVFDWECFQIIWNPPASDPQLATLTNVAAPLAVLGSCLAIYIATRRTAGARDAPRRM